MPIRWLRLRKAEACVIYLALRKRIKRRQPEYSVYSLAFKARARLAILLSDRESRYVLVTAQSKAVLFARLALFRLNFAKCLLPRLWWQTTPTKHPNRPVISNTSSNSRHSRKQSASMCSTRELISTSVANITLISYTNNTKTHIDTNKL